MRMKTLAGALTLAFGAIALPAQAVPVATELALLIDVSGSVSTSEFNLQRGGYVNAFRDPGIQSAIDSGNSLAASLVYWSGATQQVQAVGWTLIDSAASANSFADAIDATTRPYSGNTNIDRALVFATPLFESNGFEGTRKVIDISGDGTSNTTLTANARDAALAAGIDQINGLPIGGTSIENFYSTYVIGGAGSFIQAANTFADFDGAVRTKIGREIVVVPVIPEPETYALMLAGLGVMGWLSKRRKAAGKSV